MCYYIYIDCYIITSFVCNICFEAQRSLSKFKYMNKND